MHVAPAEHGGSVGSSQELKLRIDDLCARVRFGLVVGFLIVMAYAIHRIPQLHDLSLLEEEVILVVLGVFWLFFFVEEGVRLVLDDRKERLLRRLGVATLVCVIPPLRLCVPSSFRVAQIWFPYFGWQTPKVALQQRIEKYTSVPMILIALCVLPVLLLEYVWKHHVDERPGLRLFLDVSNSVIWFAFALEFFVLLAATSNRVGFSASNWINVAIISLPVIEVMPFFRVLRVARMVPQIEQLARLSRVYGQMYRFRGLYVRAWRAVLVFNLLQRLIDRNPHKRMRRLRDLLAIKEEEAEVLRKEIAAIEVTLAAVAQPPPTEPESEAPPQPLTSTSG